METKRKLTNAITETKKKPVSPTEKTSTKETNKKSALTIFCYIFFSCVFLFVTFPLFYCLSCLLDPDAFRGQSITSIGRLDKVHVSIYEEYQKNGECPIKVVNEPIEFEVPQKIRLSYVTNESYILEVQNSSESDFYWLGNNNFTISIVNRKLGKCEIVKEKTFQDYPQSGYFSEFNYDHETVCFEQRNEICRMDLEVIGDTLTFCWTDSKANKIVYHTGATSSFENFLIETDGDLLSTKIEHEITANATSYICTHLRESFYCEALTDFKGVYVENYKVKEYGWFNPVPRVKK